MEGASRTGLRLILAVSLILRRHLIALSLRESQRVSPFLHKPIKFQIPYQVELDVARRMAYRYL